MKKIFLLLFIFLLGVMPFAQKADAHVLQTDQNIGAVLHIEPEDDPIVGDPAYFFFEFKDKLQKFTPTECDCTVSVSTDHEIYSQPLFQNNQDPKVNSASFSFTFPEKNVYTIQVKGVPKTPNAFQSFTLTYPIRVDRVLNTSSKRPTNQFDFHIIYGVLILAVFVFLFAWYGIAIIRAKRGKTDPVRD